MSSHGNHRVAVGPVRLKVRACAQMKIAGLENSGPATSMTRTIWRTTRPHLIQN